MKKILHNLLVACCLIQIANAAPGDQAFDKISDIRFAKAKKVNLKLDLYLPSQTENPPLLIWVHGGGWRAGSRSDVPVLGLIDHGFAIASIDYRLSTQARFPAQAHDINAAIRFLRAQSSKYGYDASRISISGSSAGGHLAALIAAANGNRQLEGSLGKFREESSDVQAAVCFFGCGNLLILLDQTPSEEKKAFRKEALKLLLGDLPKDTPVLAALASPMLHISDTSAPMLFIHGEEDVQMPYIQGKELYEAYKASGLATDFISIPGAGHGGEPFYTEERIEQVAAFLKANLN